MNKNISFRVEKLYCNYCKNVATIEIPNHIDLSSPTSKDFVENVRCTICKNVGYITR